MYKVFYSIIFRNESIDEDLRKKGFKGEDADYDHCKEFKFASPSKSNYLLRNTSNTKKGILILIFLSYLNFFNHRLDY